MYSKKNNGKNRTVSLEIKTLKQVSFRIKDYNSIMCGYFCILLIEYMLNNKTLTDFTNLFSPWKK